jgi:hypothetical protein
MFETIKCFLWLNNVRRCIEPIEPAFSQAQIVFSVIDLQIEKSSDHIQIIDVPAKLSDNGDVIPQSIEFSDRPICFSEVRSFVAISFLAGFVLYGAVSIVFCFVDPFGANWLDSQLACFPGVESWNVLLSRIDALCSSIGHFQWHHCGLSMASAYVNGSLLMDVDVRACIRMISAFGEIFN